MNGSVSTAARPMGLVAGLFLLLATPAGFAATALPGAVDGQPLPSLAPMIERTAPAVVNIAVRGSVDVSNPLMNDPMFRRFFGNPRSQQPQRRSFESAGSGVIVDAEKGYIITNHHVVENAEEITITLMDNRDLEAEVVGSDPGSDIAVLKVEPDELTDISLGKSDNLRVGDFVVAIGNPFGLQHTVTSGIVSALGRRQVNRSNNSYEDFIQTDASINPGNSGGALVNLRGELVGVNSAIFTRSGGNIGIGFAIPVDMVRSIMEQIVEFGSVQRGLLGVNILSVNSDIVEDYDLEQNSGALVTAVSPGSAAEDAGIEVGDVITAVNDEAVDDAGDLRNTIGLLRAGERARITFVRDGRERRVNATLGELTANETPVRELAPVFEGAELVSNPDGGGVLARSVAEGSPAYMRGLRSGDVIVEVNRRPVANAREFRERLENARSIMLRVRRDDRAALLLMR